jgi:polyadenylation factor subunit 2
VSGDDAGAIKYWKPTLELVKCVAGHREPVRDLSFAPTDLKFASASDDSTIKIWDFARCATETTLAGHGGDAKAVDWHPRLGLIASGAKDALVKLWDARAGAAVATLAGHTAAITTTTWNGNGHWLLTAARDQTARVVDVRTMATVAVLKGHGRDVTAAAWHPWCEGAVATAGYDGTLHFWVVPTHADPIGSVVGAHEAAVWSLAWHPAGHVLASAGADHCSKYWARPRPGDPWLGTTQREAEAAAGARGEGGA